jgi:hypothetical protein
MDPEGSQYRRFQVLTAVKMPMLIFWVVTLCGFAGRYHRFGGTYCSEDGGNMFFRNVGGICLQVHMPLLPRRPTPTQYRSSSMS